MWSQYTGAMDDHISNCTGEVKNIKYRCISLPCSDIVITTTYLIQSAFLPPSLLPTQSDMRYARVNSESDIYLWWLWWCVLRPDMKPSQDCTISSVNASDNSQILLLLHRPRIVFKHLAWCYWFVLDCLSDCLFLLIAFIWRHSPLSRRLTALVCDFRSTWVNSFYSAFLNIHRSGVLTALAWLVPHETAALSARSIQPCTMSLHAKPHT